MFGALTPRPVSKTLRVFAALLNYPDARLLGHLPEIRQLLHEEAVLSASRSAEVETLLDQLQQFRGWLDAELIVAFLSGGPRQGSIGVGHAALSAAADAAPSRTRRSVRAASCGTSTAGSSRTCRQTARRRIGRWRG